MVMTAAHVGCVGGVDPEIMGICVLAIGTYLQHYETRRSVRACTSVYERVLLHYVV